jgi:hypothetical protein
VDHGGAGGEQRRTLEEVRGNHRTDPAVAKNDRRLDE